MFARKWGIARVKLTFYESTEEAQVMVELSIKKKQEILQYARDFMSRYRCPYFPLFYRTENPI